MKQFTTPGIKETYAKLRITVTKSRKSLGRAQLEAIQAKLEQRALKCKDAEFSMSVVSRKP